MDTNDNLLGFTLGVGLLIGAFVFVLMYILRALRGETAPANDNRKQDHKNDNAGDQQVTARSKNASNSANSAKNRKKTSENQHRSKLDKQSSFEHHWLITTLKGHSSQVLDMDLSSNGKYLVSCADDRTVMVWDIKDLTQNAHRSLRINVDFDYATLAKFSPDSKAIVINKYSANSTEVYKLEKKKDGWLANGNKSVTFPKVHDGDVISIGISCNGKFLMSASNKTDIVLFDLKGQKLGNVDTYLINNCCAKISPCGRFIAASGFTPDVVVWEVLFNKSGDFQEIKKAFTLVGHTSGVYDIAFDADTSHMATVSKDGTWKLYDTKIDYKRGENPHLKISTKYESSSGSNSIAKIALSPNAEVLALSTNDTLTMYYTDDGLVDCEITGLPAVSQLLFDSTGKHLYLSSDRHIRVFHNVTGYTSSINTAREKLKQNQTSATKERLHEIIRDSEKFLKDFIQN